MYVAAAPPVSGNASLQHGYSQVPKGGTLKDRVYVQRHPQLVSMLKNMASHLHLRPHTMTAQTPRLLPKQGTSGSATEYVEGAPIEAEVQVPMCSEVRAAYAIQPFQSEKSNPFPLSPPPPPCHFLPFPSLPGGCSWRPTLDLTSGFT